MNINNVKRAKKRIDTAYLSNLGIQSYGRDNLYPQRMYDLIRSSANGGTCCERYQTFIEGNGLNNTDFAEYECNRIGQTVDDIYRLLAQDMAYHHGFALHVNYNMMCQIVEINHIPFMQCRLEEETPDGKVVHIKIHPDWTGHKTRKGKTIRVSNENIKNIYTFNPRREVVMSQIEASGGIEKYRGQVLWFSMDGKWDYPVPIYDKVVTSLSSDEGLDNVMYRNVRNNFLVAGMLIHKKGSTLGIDDEGNPIKDEKESDISESLNIFQGDENACAIMDVTIESEDDKPDFVKFEAANFDKKYERTEESVTSRIYAAFGQEPWYRIRNGSLGFSSEVLSEAYEYYNSYVSKERRAISRALKRIFDHWHEDVNPSGDYEVQPLVYVSNAKK
jgi:hypothetical protein